MRFKTLLVLIMIVLGAFAGHPVMAAQCADHGTVEQSAHGMHQHSTAMQSTAHSEKTFPEKTPCKIACAALCMSLCMATINPQSQIVVRLAASAQYLTSRSPALVGVALPPPLHPPSSLFV